MQSTFENNEIYPPKEASATEDALKKGQSQVYIWLQAAFSKSELKNW